jgi:hypothetical protein
MMEKDGVITRMERIGISTTELGTRKLVELMTNKYTKEVEAVIGQAFFNELKHRVMRETKGRQ